MSSPSAPRPLDDDVASTGQAAEPRARLDGTPVGGAVSEKLVCARALVESRRAAATGQARWEALVAGLNAVVWERDPVTLRCSYINDRVEELLGYPVARWLAEPGLWERILHPEDRDTALRRVRQAVDGREADFSLSYRARARDGRWLWVHHLGHVARDEAGRARTLHVVLTDVTADKRREQAAALLAAAGQALTVPGSVEERLTAVAELTVGPLGDRAVVWLRGDDDRYRVVAAAPTAQAIRIRDVPALTVPDRQRPLVDAGRPFILGQVSEQLRRTAADGDGGFVQLSADLGAGQSRLVVPLLAGEERVGLLTVSATDPDRRYDADDLALAGDLGQRIATMVGAERVAARQRQLHALTAALSAAGTVAEAAAALTAGLRRALAASVVAVLTLGPDGLLHTVHTSGYPPEQPAWFATMRLSAPWPPAQAVRTRAAVWLADRRALAEGFPRAEPHVLPSTEGAAALPLLAAGRVFGSLSVTFTTPRRFDDGERAFLRTVAHHLALALERATLADVRREMADVLQRSLLPARVPEVDGLEVVTRYLPAVRGTAAGGDWYDVHRLACGRVAVAVGDTVGNGSAAAAVMGVLRNSLAALLVAGHPPAEALSLLDAIADDVPGAAVSTVACLRLDPATGELTYSRAGHPPPLLIDADGGATWLDQAPGRALGLPEHGARPEARTVLPAGATLLCFTDGLVERHDDVLDAGLARLAAAATARRAAPLAQLVDGVLADLVDVDGAGDDIAVVAIRARHPSAEKRYSTSSTESVANA